jgi:hypothetical protein
MKLGKNASDICAMLSEACGGEAMKNSSIFEWHKGFKEGCENMKDGERSSCPRSHRTNKNVEKVWNLVHSDRYLSIRTMAMKLNLDKETVRHVLSDDLGVKMIGFCHDNALTHKALSVKQFLSQN